MHFRGIRLIFFVFAVLTGLLTATFAAPTLSEKDFRSLVRDLAPKVNLFAEVWRHDPKASFYGGTSRDFLYWVLGQLKTAQNPKVLEERILFLRRLKVIDIKEFVGSESDVDILSEEVLNIDAAKYGVRKLDFIEKKRLDLRTKWGDTEVNQGYIPVEKIELLRSGVSTSDVFGNGVEEILTGNLSIHFTPDEVFWKTHYAEQRLNHPALLAIRYLRIRAMDWFYTHGDAVPDLKELLQFDEATQAKLRQVIREAERDPRFKEMLEQEKGLRWFNGSLLKAFRSYTNPTVAHMLFTEFGYQRLQTAFPQLESINQFLFVQHRDPAAIEANLKKFKVKAKDLYMNPRDAFPDFSFFHGTRQEAWFRAIIFQNIMPSGAGNAGAGLYGVNREQQKTAIDLCKDPNLVIEFRISPTAKIIDITQGLGQKLLAKWQEKHPNDFDGFAKAFGADILKYPYYPYAFVVKNSSVLIGRQGLTRQLLSIGKIIETAKSVTTPESFRKLLETVHFNALSEVEWQMVLQALDSTKLTEWTMEMHETIPWGQLRPAIPYLPTEKKISVLKDIIRKTSTEGDDLMFYNEIFDHMELTTAQKVEIVEDLIQTSKKIEFFQWLISYCLFNWNDGSSTTYFSPKIVDRWIKIFLKDRKLGQTILAELAERKNGELEVGSDGALQLAPISTISAKAYQNAFVWLDQIIQLNRSAEFILSSDLLLIAPPLWGRSRQGWKDSEKMDSWINRFLESKHPHPNILTLILMASRVYGGRGKNIAKYDRAKLTRWIKDLLKNPHIPKSLRSQLPEIIISQDIFCPGSVNLVLENIAENYAIEKNAFAYLKRHAGNDRKVQRYVARRLLRMMRVTHKMSGFREAFETFFANTHVRDPETLRVLKDIVSFRDFLPSDHDFVIRRILRFNGLESKGLEALAEAQRKAILRLQWEEPSYAMECRKLLKLFPQ